MNGMDTGTGCDCNDGNDHRPCGGHGVQLPPDGDGFAIWYKRLEVGTFRFPACDTETKSMTITRSGLAVMKFADHTPLARQATQVFKRSGIELAQSSMCRWMAKAAELLEPLYELMRELILLSYCFGIDVTNVKYREPGVKGKCKTGFVVQRKIPASNASGLMPTSGSSTGMQRPCVAGAMARVQAWKASKDYSGILRCDAHTIYDDLFEPKVPKPGTLAPAARCWKSAFSSAGSLHRRKYN